MVQLFSIKVQYQQAVADLAALNKKLDPRQLLAAIGLRQIKWSSDNIKGGGVPDAWKQMAENTLTASPQRTSSRNFSSHYQSQLMQGLTSEVKGRSSVEVGINAPYVDYHHEGTHPYIIRPVKARVLAFQVASGNVATRLGIKKPIQGSLNMVLTREVHHPGVPARPMLPSKAVAEQLAVAVVDAVVAKATEAAAARQ